MGKFLSDAFNNLSDTVHNVIDNLFFKTTVNPDNENFKQVHEQNQAASEATNGAAVHPGGAEAYAMAKGLANVLPGSSFIIDAEQLADTNNSACERVAAGLGVAAGVAVGVAASLDNLGNAAKTERQSQKLAAEDTLKNKIHHIFDKPSHNLEDLVAKFGSREAAYNAVQDAANQALKAGKLTPDINGILPTGDLGNIIDAGGIKIRLIGGQVENGRVNISSFSRRGL